MGFDRQLIKETFSSDHYLMYLFSPCHPTGQGQDRAKLVSFPGGSRKRVCREVGKGTSTSVVLYRVCPCFRPVVLVVHGRGDGQDLGRHQRPGARRHIRDARHRQERLRRGQPRDEQPRPPRAHRRPPW